MMRRMDESPFLNRMLQTVSARMAKQRGLPVVIGIAMILVSMLVGLLNVALDSKLLDALYVILHDGGIVVALIGLLMVEPLGK
jgi:hypothetical protein